MKILATLVLLIILSVMNSCSQSLLSQNEVESLPELSLFISAPSTHFLVDLETVSHTTPFVGSNNEDSHSGAHVHFQNDGEIADGSNPNSYPAIYAVADGTITRVDTYFAVNDNFKYEIILAFAKEGNETVEFEYSIEPMINPNDPDSYIPFVQVTEGQTVSAGEIIAHMLVKDGIGNGPHIHFNLSHSLLGRQAPAIFSSDILEDFFDKLEEPGNCIGIDLTAAENPQGTGAVNCL